MKNYIVIESNDKTSFNKMVSDALNEGYECEGGVCSQQIVSEIHGYLWTHYAQGMVKTT